MTVTGMGGLEVDGEPHNASVRPTKFVAKFATIHHPQPVWRPGIDVVCDVRGRLPVYRDDWRSATQYGARLLAPSLYIFFCSMLPALAFGEQLAGATSSQLTVVSVLASTAISGAVQAVLGGQPLLIIGVAEPIVVIYDFMYRFAEGRDDLGPGLFLPWAAWVCVWTAVLVAAGAVLGTTRLINRFTRMCGELFGMLIAVLFMQEAIKGLISEFDPTPSYKTASPAADLPAWRLVNGVWALVLAWGLLLTALAVMRARTWRLGTGWMRGLLADYGVPLAVVAWSGLSFALQAPSPFAGQPAGGELDTVPQGIPRRITTPDTWQVQESWLVAGRMGQVPGQYIAAALIPAIVIAVLFWFDHGVSSKMAQPKEYHLTKPSAYAYDMLLLAGLTLLTGLLGLPPVNGVLPQAPMHTRALATMRMQHEASAAAREAGRKLGAEAGRKAHPGVQGGAEEAVAWGAELADTHVTAQHTAVVVVQQHEAGVAAEQPTVGVWADGACTTPVRDLHSSGQSNGAGHEASRPAGAPAGADTGAAGLPAGELERGGEVGKGAAGGVPLAVVEAPAGRLRVAEQRVSNLAQALLVAACLGATPAIRQIPTAVVWGYFAYMALDSLPGSQFWDRLVLLLTDPHHRSAHAGQQVQAPYVGRVPFVYTAAFTFFQLSYLMGVWALITWAGIAGVVFPVAIVALIPVRQYVLPRVMPPAYLACLDGEEDAAVVAVASSTSAAGPGKQGCSSRATPASSPPSRTATPTHVPSTC